MTRTVKPPNCRCIPCDFNCNASKWNLDGQEMDCFGCDGSGIDTRCEEHKEKDYDRRPKCTACGDQPLQAKQDQCGLPFCDKCYEEMRRGSSDE